MLSPFECLCGNFILPEPASYVFFYAFSNLRNLLYIISYAQCLLERQSASTAPEVFLAVTRLLHHMANIFQDNSLPQSGTGLIHADRKLREQLREKRLAHGHKVDDHEEQQYGGWNMTMK